MTRLWHGVIAALAAFALVGQTALSIDRDRSLVNLFSYFTIESNVLVMVAAALIAVRPDRGGTAFGILRLGGLTAITITGIVYATVLAGNTDFSGIEWWYDKIFHYAVPVLSVLGFLLFRPGRGSSGAPSGSWSGRSPGWHTRWSALRCRTRRTQ